MEERIAGLYDIGLDEANDQVSVGMRRRHVDDLDRLSREMKFHAVVTVTTGMAAGSGAYGVPGG